MKATGRGNTLIIFFLIAQYLKFPIDVHWRITIRSSFDWNIREGS